MLNDNPRGASKLCLISLEVSVMADDLNAIINIMLRKDNILG